MWIDVRMNLNVFLRVGSFPIRGGLDINTFIVASSLQLKQHFTS
jgi:hypothetical protein